MSAVRKSVNAGVFTLSKSNAVTSQQCFEEIEELGKVHGMAADVQIRMSHTLIKAGYQGTLDLTRKKHNGDMDDATKACEVYVLARNKNVKFDHKAPNQRKTASTFRKCIQFGGTTKWGSSQPMQLVNDFLSRSLKVRSDPKNVNKLDDAQNSLMRLIRLQLKRDQIISADEMEALMFKPARKEKDNLKLIDELQRKAQALLDGRTAVHDTSPQVQAIIDACKERKIAILDEIRQAEAEAKAEDFEDTEPANEMAAAFGVEEGVTL